MCPLRYILLFLSLIVAMVGFSQAMTEQEQISHLPREDEEEEYNEHGELVKATKKSTVRTLVDMLNGKYLYDAWKASQLRVKTA